MIHHQSIDEPFRRLQLQEGRWLEAPHSWGVFLWVKFIKQVIITIL